MVAKLSKPCTIIFRELGKASRLKGEHNFSKTRTAILFLLLPASDLFMQEYCYQIKTKLQLHSHKHCR
jgi:hypothetical protein